MEQFPPPDFIVTDSKVDGVVIYMPRPDEIDHKEVEMYRCARCNGQMRFDNAQNSLQCESCGNYETACNNCGASMVYMPDSHHLACQSCDTTAAVQHTGPVGTRAEQKEFREQYLDQAARGWGVAMKEIMCQSCGAEIVVEPNQLTTRCGACGSNKIVQQKEVHDVQRPNFLIPFAIDDNRCHDIASEWLGKTWLVPKAAKKFASVGEFTQLYVPFWTFDAACKGNWKAEVGHERTVRRDGKTHTEIIWRWESGYVSSGYNNVQVSGTTHVRNDFMEDVASYDLSTLTEYDGKYLLGTQALAYDTPLQTAWGSGRHIMRSDMLGRAKRGPSTGRVRNFQMDMGYANEAWRYILVPLVIATYFYNNQPYQMVLNGQDGSITGQRPADWRKIITIFTIPLVIGLILLAIGYFAVIEPLLIAGGALLALGVILAIVLGLMGSSLKKE